MPQDTRNQDTTEFLPQVDATKDKPVLPLYPGSAQLGSYQGNHQPVQVMQNSN